MLNNKDKFVALEIASKNYLHIVNHWWNRKSPVFCKLFINNVKSERYTEAGINKIDTLSMDQFDYLTDNNFIELDHHVKYGDIALLKISPLGMAQLEKHQVLDFEETIL